MLQQELGTLLENHAYCNLRKKENLHKRWTEQVYEPLRKEIIRQIDCSGKYESLADAKQELYGQYLEQGNWKVDFIVTCFYSIYF